MSEYRSLMLYLTPDGDMTDNDAIGTAIAGELYLNRPSSSGFPASVLDIRTADEDGQSLKPGDRGEVQVQGTSMFRGYWNNQKATDEVAYW